MINNYENIQDIKTVKSELKKEYINEYVSKYVVIITEFILYNSSKKHYRTLEYNQYVTYQGIQTLFHIYHQLLMHTKNIDLVSYHVQKAYYYYIEFISQINKEQHSFLQFNIKDAIMFIYKKTIFNLDKQLTSTLSTSETDEYILRNLYEVTNKINHLLMYVTDIIRINSNQDNENSDNNMIEINGDTLTEELFFKSSSDKDNNIKYNNNDTKPNTKKSNNDTKRIDDYDRLTYIIQKLIKDVCEHSEIQFITEKINNVLMNYKTTIREKTYKGEKYNYTKLSVKDTLIAFTDMLQEYSEK
jgi:hypothetical protein